MGARDFILEVKKLALAYLNLILILLDNAVPTHFLNSIAAVLNTFKDFAVSLFLLLPRYPAGLCS